MKNRFHEEILRRIEENSGKPVQDAISNSYMGNNHVFYPISIPALRVIAKEWMRSHRNLTAPEFAEVLSSLIKSKSSTEKIMAGILMGYSAKPQRTFNPDIFDQWLDHIAGWAEVDALCTGDFSRTEIPGNWTKWKKLIIKLSKDPNVNKRRASLVLFCSPLSRVRDERLAQEAFKRMDKLKLEKEVMITKAVSWLLRSMIRHYRNEVSDYVTAHIGTLPKIAVRETLAKLKTGRKTKLKEV